MERQTNIFVTAHQNNYSKSVWPRHGKTQYVHCTRYEKNKRVETFTIGYKDRAPNVADIEDYDHPHRSPP